MDGGNDADTLQGGAGNDVVNGKLGDDVLDGGPGTDQLIGENGADSMYGGFGNDSLLGGLGNDTLYGGPGNDNLNGNEGKNTCDGGTGSNVFAGCSSTVNPGGPDPAGDWADTDADGVVDAIEIRAGTDLLKADTDADGLADSAELQSITDPTKTDTDGNGISDAADDPDTDGLTTADELGRGTKAGEPDTDGDSLTDGQEVARGSNPLAVDTDLDGLSDAEEQELGSDPLVSDADSDGVPDGQEQFSTDLTLDSPAATFHAVGTGKAVLAVQLYAPEDGRLTDVPGQRGPPVEVIAPLPLDSGTLTLGFEQAAFGEDLVVLHFDEETATFDEPAVQSVDHASSTAMVTTTDFSPFIVVNRAEYAAAWSGDLAAPREHFDIVLVMTGWSETPLLDPSKEHVVAASEFAHSRIVAGDRVAVVESKQEAQLLQELTSDPTAVDAALTGQQFDFFSWSGGWWSKSIETSLDTLDTYGAPDRNRVIVIVDDGFGRWNRSYDYTSRAIASSTVIYGANFFPRFKPANLDVITEATGGQFFWTPSPAGVADSLSLISAHLDGSLVPAPDGTDSDGDGLTDTVETNGCRDGSGRVFHTEPDRADTDADGLSDGDEAGGLRSDGTFGTGTYYTPVSNPTRQDTDGDTLGDLYEVADGLLAWNADYDRDGLSDAVETQVHSTEPWLDDGDVDGYTDMWEIDHASEGFDPLIFDYQTSILEYIGEFSRGALCGDITNLGPFCEGQSLAYLAGNISSGVVFIGDIRDAIAGVVNLDFISTAFSVAALIPIGGDIAAGIKKTEKFIRAADEIPSGAALRSTMKDFGKSTADKMDLLRKVSPTAVTKLTTAGLPEADIVRLASRMISAKHFDDMVKAANDIKKAPNTYRLEKDAETFLRANTPGALPTQIRSQTVTGDTRYYDVLDPRSRRAIEIKHGRARDVGRAASQADRDDAMRKDPLGDVLSVEWHFFTSNNNTLGPDVELLKRLGELSIPFTLWVA